MRLHLNFNCRGRPFMAHSIAFGDCVACATKGEDVFLHLPTFYRSMRLNGMSLEEALELTLIHETIHHIRERNHHSQKETRDWDTFIIAALFDVTFPHQINMRSEAK